MNSQEAYPTLKFKSINSSGLNLLYGPTFTSVHDYWKTVALTIRALVGKVMFLLFNMLSRFVMAFLPRIKHLLILWLQSPSAVILDPKTIKSVTASTFSHNLPWSDGTRSHDLSFLNVELNKKVLSQLFHSPLSLSSRGSLFYSILGLWAIWSWLQLFVCLFVLIGG